MGKNCHDCIHSMGNADGVLWCYEPTGAGPAPGEACEHFEREPGADACERDPSRVFYAGDDWSLDLFRDATKMICTICGRAGHVAASCKGARK